MKLKYTKERVEKNRKYVEVEITRVKKVVGENKLKGVLVVYNSPVTETLESIVGYFEDYTEALLWLDEKDKRYNELNIDHCTYMIV